LSAVPCRHVLWGSAGHAKVLASLIERLGGRVVALFDNREIASALPGIEMHVGEAGFERWCDQAGSVTDVVGLAAIGGHRGRDRLAIHALFRSRGLRIGTLVHPDASVCASATLGAGTQVLAFGLVAADARVGEACIVNHRASIDHECVLGDGVHLAPGATLCGLVTLEHNVMVGAGAVVLPRVRIGADAIVGAGAVVVRDVPPAVVVAGNPARILRPGT
jgi:sugar O-acyltransferase (sialic acid O-acetyltransferase NeuD family)